MITKVRNVAVSRPFVASVNLVVTVCAIGALVIALTTLQQERHAGRVDLCHTLTRIVYAAYPPNQKAQASALLKVTGLSDCQRFGGST